LSLASSGLAEDQQSSSPSTVSIENFGRVNSNYYRGGQPDGRDYADLAALGIRTVIDLRDDGDVKEPDNVRSAGMTFYRIPMTTRAQPAPAAVAQFLGLVNDPANQPVYVHCMGGRHRTGIMTAVYRMTQDGWTADRAFAEMEGYKFGPAFLHSALKNFVYDYYGRLDHATASARGGAPAKAGG
jgi:tyrosine-protein phosphatase SIW14